MIGIKDFGMPRCCVNCQMCDAYEKGTCVITETECADMYSQRNGDCPLVEIPESIIINGDMSANNIPKQIMWERDTAILQLKALGYGLCEKPKMGHWKRISTDKYSQHAMYWYRCDRCGENNLGNTDWCPNCGARMESEDKNE